MKPIPIKMYCKNNFVDYIVYCYKIGDTVVCNGCEQFHSCQTCYECCNKAVEIYKENLRSETGDFAFHES